ncbi:phage Gp37/Gp68 family protein [Aurantimonas coralicida]|uniref:phage Gp37/Gp68 family protein n=1 Tax=Aurantimonas coralicida TaxID=182270 RepID=UPI001E3338F8|nr:phage Gp37/Gp68 family protein [Aurantimonas coralicida]MCD1645300.1 phage Gp37/Gp68 family protein [Aurantimonas coralicida]
MAENTKISWCDFTHNHWIGCLKVSPACDGCYAEAMMDKRYGRVQWGAPGKGAGTRSLTSEANRRKPLSWNRRAAKAGTRPFVFCSSLADVFDNHVPEEWRRDLFDLIRSTPNLVWLLLTKRPQNIVKMAEACGGLPANAAIGATCEDQERTDKNVPPLLDAKAKLKPAFAFLSCEPLLGPIDLMTVKRWSPLGSMSALPCEIDGVYLDWIITGGETDQGGHKARPSHPDWFRSLRDQCEAAGVPFHHKQNGEWVEGEPSSPWRLLDTPMQKIGKARSGRTLDGVTHDAFPAVLAMPAREAA